MPYDIFHSYGLDKVYDSLTENHDYKDNDSQQWKLVKVKTVQDSDGFNTEYAWYTNGDKHIFMFGDTDLYEPDEDYADWVAETQTEAEQWFDTYTGFEEDEDVWKTLDAEDVDVEFSGNADFMNEGLARIYGFNDCETED